MASSLSTPVPPVSGQSLSRHPSGGYYVFLILYLVLMSAFGSFVNDMYIPSLPEMVRSFHTDTSTVQLGLTFGMLGLAIGELFLGPLSDKYGRKPILVIALIVFCVGAVCSIWSKTIHEFIWWRLVQGFGASGGYFLARTIPADLYQGRALAKVMALVGAINGFAPASAPVLGGLMAKAVGWRGIFWTLAGFSVLLLILSPALKESLPKSKRESVKLKQAFGNFGVLIKNNKFVMYTLMKGTALGILFAYIASAPFIIQDHYGYTQLQFGLFMGFNALFVACGSMLALKFNPLIKAAKFGAIALTGVVAIQFACFYLKDNIWVYEGLNLPMLLCLGMMFTTGNTLAMNEGRECAGDASALVGIAGYIFGAVVSPLVGLKDIYHSTAITIGILAILVLVSTLLSVKLTNSENQK